MRIPEKQTKKGTYGVAEILGNGDDLGELDRLGRGIEGRKVVEDVRQSSREDTLDLCNLVSSVDQIVQGVDNRQSSANGRLMVDQGGTRSTVSNLLDLLVEAQVTREGLLVGGDDMEASLEPGGVVGSNVLVGGAVENDGGVGDLGGSEGGGEGVEGECL